MGETIMSAAGSSGRGQNHDCDYKADDDVIGNMHRKAPDPPKLSA
jgi:hypothetical protein